MKTLKIWLVNRSPFDEQLLKEILEARQKDENTMAYSSDYLYSDIIHLHFDGWMVVFNTSRNRCDIFRITTVNDPIRQLVKAGALIAAEIDRLQRKADGKLIEK